MVKHTPGTDTIEEDIRATRRSIDDKVDRIQRRLSPGDMVDSVVDFARANGGAIAGGIGRGVRDNPVPVALIGAGVLWLALSSYARRHEEEVASAIEAGESAADNLRHKAADLRDGVRDSVRSGAGQARRRAGELGEQARHRAVRARQSGGRFVKEHPVLVGAAGIALGAAVAASLPRSGREDRAFGDRADRAKTAAKEAAVKEGRKVQEAAKAAVAKARETAERKAPTAGEVKRDAEQSLHAAGEPKKTPGAAG